MSAQGNMYDFYKNTTLKQEELLFKTFETSIKNTHENEVKSKNLKDVLLKELKAHFNFIPTSQLLSKAYSKVLEGMEANVRVDARYNERLQEVLGTITKTKEDINRRKDEATKSAEAFKKMEEAKVKYTAVSSQANNPDFLKLQNAYNTARVAFENTEKNNMQYIKEFEIKKGDFTLVLRSNIL
eukprot:TRINITY_DN13122_c0_g1_i11.p1 TRINITY_DN13122_c0_g1~~TRINITY_DN13122_c0_g1_i11.p1  ORF type:complete len:184 (+),score=82.26 TRINITY_DN13122_c0_g1_i11:119-670(+)